MNSYHIRHATISDIADIITIEKSASRKFVTLPHEFLVRLPKELPVNGQNFYQQLIQKNGCFVICERQKIVGFIATESVANENTIHIWELDVDLAYQRKGLGKLLINYIITQAEQSKTNQITLTTFRDVPWNSPFYQKLGFVIVENPNHRLLSLIDNEVSLGFPRELRCAMVLVL